jgi:CTP:molybdopterin cytidylyltransferase MocA
LSPAVAAVVLAAGRGERFGGEIPKPLIDFGGRPLVARAVDAAVASECAPVLVVVADDVVAATIPEPATAVRNDDPARGISSSLQCALRVLAAQTDVEAVVVGLADQPLVGADAYRRLAQAHAEGARLAVATYAGTRGNPVLLAREFWAEAERLSGDEGARALFRRHDPREVPCDGTGDPSDVDTPDDLARLETQWRSQRASE